MQLAITMCSHWFLASVNKRAVRKGSMASETLRCLKCPGFLHCSFWWRVVLGVHKGSRYSPAPVICLTQRALIIYGGAMNHLPVQVICCWSAHIHQKLMTFPFRQQCLILLPYPDSDLFPVQVPLAVQVMTFPPGECFGFAPFWPNYTTRRQLIWQCVSKSYLLI